MAAEQRADAGVQLFQRERFHQIVIRAGVETADAIFNGIAGGQDQNRLAEFFPAHARQEVQTIFIRQAEVEYDQAVMVAGEGQGGLVSSGDAITDISPLCIAGSGLVTGVRRLQ